MFVTSFHIKIFIGPHKAKKLPRFLGIDSLVLHFRVVLETPMKCVTAAFFGKKCFALKMGKMYQKEDFLNLLKNWEIYFFQNLVYNEA